MAYSAAASARPLMFGETPCAVSDLVAELNETANRSAAEVLNTFALPLEEPLSPDLAQLATEVIEAAERLRQVALDFGLASQGMRA